MHWDLTTYTVDVRLADQTVNTAKESKKEKTKKREGSAGDKSLDV